MDVAVTLSFRVGLPVLQNENDHHNKTKMKIENAQQQKQVTYKQIFDTIFYYNYCC
jgi:hypothetical protein